MDLYTELKAVGMTGYGQVIPAALVHKIMGITMPEVGTKADFDAATLAELDAVDSAKEILLREGKYLKKEGGFYRILLPSENIDQVARYHLAADRKLRRAQLLRSHTPTVPTSISAGIDVALHLKMHSRRA